MFEICWPFSFSFFMSVDLLSFVSILLGMGFQFCLSKIELLDVELSSSSSFFQSSYWVLSYVCTSFYDWLRLQLGVYPYMCDKLSCRLLFPL